MRISDWSSDVCSSDLDARQGRTLHLIASGFPRLARDPEHRAFPGSGVTDDIANTASGRDMLQRAALLLRELQAAPSRSEERRVGKECVSTCRSRWSPSHTQKKTQKRIR